MVDESWSEDDGIISEREGGVSSEANLTRLNVDLLLGSPALVSSKT